MVAAGHTDYMALTHQPELAGLMPGLAEAHERLLEAEQKWSDEGSDQGCAHGHGARRMAADPATGATQTSLRPRDDRPQFQETAEIAREFRGRGVAS